LLAAQRRRSRGEARWTLRSYTIEGDPIPTTLLFRPAGGIGLVVTRDTSADKFGGVGNQRVFTNCT